MLLNIRIYNTGQGGTRLFARKGFHAHTGIVETIRMLLIEVRVLMWPRFT